MPWTTTCSERHIRTPPVQICTPPTCPTITTALDCVYTNCTYLGDLVAHCTPGARHRDHSRHFTIPWTTICSERHFRTRSVQNCTTPTCPTITTALDCVYTNCTYLGDLVAHCTPGARSRDRSRQFNIPWTTICSERHFRTRSVQNCTPPTYPTITTVLSCVHTNCAYLEDLVAHCIPAVRLRDRSQLFTLRCKTICRERHFRTPFVRICTVPQSLRRTAHLVCEYTNCTYLGNLVPHCTPGV